MFQLKTEHIVPDQLVSKKKARRWQTVVLAASVFASIALVSTIAFPGLGGDENFLLPLAGILLSVFNGWLAKKWFFVSDRQIFKDDIPVVWKK